MNARSVITLDVLQDVIQAAEPAVTLDSFEMEAGCGRGDNYTAMLFRVAVRGRVARRPEDAGDGHDGDLEWRGSLICKVLPTSARQREAFKSELLFRNEVVFYTRALPALRSFEARRGRQGRDDTLQGATAAAPRCFLARDNLIVLEDLRTRGFTMLDRQRGLDEEHLRAVLSHVARFHALSLAMKALEPDEFARHVSSAIRETQFLACNEAWYSSYYHSVNRHAIGMVHDGLDDGEERARCVTAASAFLLGEGEGEGGSFFKRMIELVRPVEPLAVLCHGDCWTNNLLFRTDAAGQIEEVMLVDYQMSRYASPCLDLVLLLYSCTERAVREALMQPLMQLYHSTMIDTMHQLGCTTPDYAQPEKLWDMLASEMSRVSRFGLGQAVDYIPCLCCDSEEAPNVYDGQGDGEDDGGRDSESGDEVDPTEGPSPVLIANERCVRRIADLVQELVTKGEL